MIKHGENQFINVLYPKVHQYVYVHFQLERATNNIQNTRRKEGRRLLPVNPMLAKTMANDSEVKERSHDALEMVPAIPVTDAGNTGGGLFVSTVQICSRCILVQRRNHDGSWMPESFGRFSTSLLLNSGYVLVYPS